MKNLSTSSKDENQKTQTEKEEQPEEGIKKKNKSVKEHKKRLEQIEIEIENRERNLLPVYKRISLMFAELHDTPGRMKGVGVIKDVIPWKYARKYFYWRLRKRLIYNQCIELILFHSSTSTNSNQNVNSNSNINQNVYNGDKKIALSKFEQWLKDNCENKQNENVEKKKENEEKQIYEEDRSFVYWFDEHRNLFDNYLKQIQQENIKQQIELLLAQYSGNKQDIQTMINQLLKSNSS